MQSLKFKSGDEVKVTAGKDKGRKGKIDKLYPGKHRVRVAGLNVYKRHVKGFAGKEGGIVQFSRPLPVANVALVCPKCGKQTRVHYLIDRAGRKRVCAKCKRIIQPKENK